MSYCHFDQVKLFLHIAIQEDTASISQKDWQRKLDPVSSHLCKKSKVLVIPDIH